MKRTPEVTAADPDPSHRHHQFQQQYYQQVDRRAIRPVDSPYVRRHFQEVVASSDLVNAHHILEIGCGSGRFTRLLADMPAQLTANDLSEDLLRELRSTLPDGRLNVLPGAVSKLADRTLERFDRAVGFFILHHIFDLDRAFASLARVLEPGARIAFCEPNGLHPLFYAQILCSPSMRWKAERGIVRMRPKIVLGALERQGFVDLECRAYGFFPPFLTNRSPFRRLEQWIEGFSWLRPARTFLVFSGRRPS